MSTQQQVKKSSRKIGRGNSKLWIASGGPARCARRKAKNHGCGLVAFHLVPRDQAHSHKHKKSAS